MPTKTKERSLSTIGYYDSHAREYSESTLSVDMYEIYDRFLKELSPDAHILDAGCGSGRDTKAFLDRGYFVTAIDASPELTKIATLHTGQECRVLLFQEMNFREKFDGIWVCASLLHVPRSEMDEVMRHFVQALKTGGIMYVSLKEGDGERALDDGRLFVYYTEDSFGKFLCRFPSLREVRFWKTQEKRLNQHTSPWLNFLLKKVVR